MRSMIRIGVVLVLSQTIIQSQPIGSGDEVLYFVANNGDYAGLGRDGKLIAQANLWERIFASKQQQDEYSNLKYMLIFDAVRDPARPRLFFLVGLGHLDGYVITDLNLRFQQFFEKRMALGPK